MSPNAAPPVTQRAYTLRLRRGPGKCLACQKDDCDCWRDALWATHEAVNRGAKAFGDWLLTLRGGLCHALADMEVPANRRVLLALSWLSVEDERGAPDGDGLRIATGKEPADKRGEAVKAALREILEKRGVQASEIEKWVRDCGPSLEARIREDAVWVNRSAVFDERAKELKGLTREYAQTTTMSFFGPEGIYFALPATGSNEESGDDGAGADEGPEFRRLARQWVSTNFGTGDKSDTGKIVKMLRKLGKADLSKFARRPKSELIESMSKKVSGPTHDLDGLRIGIGWSTGRFSKGRLAINNLSSRPTMDDIKVMQGKFTEEADEKERKSGTRDAPVWMAHLGNCIERACGMPFVRDRNHIGEFSVMLDHAARRVSIAHSWIKLAEQRRRQFESDAKKLNELRDNRDNAVAWLDQFCADRSSATGAGAEGGYRIRKRAVEGWGHVVKAWARSSCKTSDERIAAARDVQADPEIEKFGDIQLFEALATDEAACVWRDETDKPDASILIDYVAGTTAEHDQKRFKVPAYRHPDALRHPVFCDFGNSRWAIRFAIHDVVKARSKGKRAKKDTNGHQNRHGLRMGLWNGNSVNDVDLKWSSKRLTKDLALDDNPDAKAISVTRADRLGRAASGAVGPAAIKNVFEEKDWNGRLQAPRAQLDRIAELEDHGHQAPAEGLRRRLRWLVSFSPRLRPSGPFIEYAASEGIEPNRKGEYYPNAPVNKGREGLAKLALSRLPGLRVLSVDLGHRFAASCAVWEAVPNAVFKKEIAHLEVLAGGPGKDDLYLHVTQPGNDAKTHTVIYRRIGPNNLPDGKAHPAPWARLDRQFLIKLQGEDEETREASDDEIWAVHKLEAELGRAVPLIDRMVRGGFGQTDKQKRRLETLRGLGWKPATTNVQSGAAGEEEGEARTVSRSVDELMFSAVRAMRLALKRHGDRARVAFGVMAEFKPMPGDRKYYFHEAKDASTGDVEATRRGKRIEFLQDALSLWHDLFSSRGWKDDAAKTLWDQHVATLPEYQTPEEIAEDLTGIERKKKRKENRDKLRAAAEALAADDQRRETLHEAWKKRWESDDEQWNKRLRWFKDWILPRGKAGDDPGIRHVGGLSLTRLATLTEFRRKVQVGFFTRLRPDGTKPEIKESFGQATLDALDRLREQRVKQLASRIVEAALGIGRIKTPKGGKTPKRPSKAVDAPCHAVVIESLTHYRPDDLRTRRENRQLMTWSSSKVKKYLAEACQLNGLHLREVPAGYTSRQDSRTGAPGIRCQDVPAKDFMQSPFWRKQVAQAEKKGTEGKGGARERFLVDLNAKWKDRTEAAWKSAGSVRIPLKGGELFVSADPRSPTAKGIQADLNAAANIGLRALLDPDWSGRWWYVPCKAGTSDPVLDRIKGSKAFEGVQSLPADGAAPAGSEASKGQPKKNRGRAPKEIENLWRDPSSDGLAAGRWKQTQAYWNDVQYRAVRLMRKRAGLDSDG
jgi:hypothetical protein